MECLFANTDWVAPALSLGVALGVAGAWQLGACYRSRMRSLAERLRRNRMTLQRLRAQLRASKERERVTLRASDDAGRALARAARLATIGEITAGITHEVNQPLGAILNNAETGLFLLRKKRPSLETLKAILEDIRSDDLRASEVVRRTRALLQHRAMLREQVNLSHVLADAVGLLWLQARRRGVTLTFSATSLPLVEADAVHLQQVIINIIGNALDATELTLGDKRVHVTADCVGDCIRVSVTDSGCGIPTEDLETIFESFHTSKPEGLGLGLSIARAIVRAHEGRIFAENNQHGPGATVSFEIPIPVDASTVACMPLSA